MADPTYDVSDEVEIDLEKGKIVERAAPTEPDPEIEVVDDTPPEDRGRRPADPPEEVTDDELASYDEKVQKRIKKFTRGYHDERRAKETALREREAAEALARQALEENQRLKAQLADGSKEYITQAQKLAQMDLERAQRTYQEAFESNDAATMAKAQAEIAQASFRAERAKDLKPLQELETRVQPQPQAPRVDPKTQTWKERNTWFGSNGPMTAYALALDKELSTKGYVPGSDAYFSEIDHVMQSRFPEAFGSPEPESRPATPRASKPATVVAPAARSTPPTRIRLTASEVAVANRLGVPLELYAKQKAAQLKEAQNG